MKHIFNALLAVLICLSVANLAFAQESDYVASKEDLYGRWAMDVKSLMEEDLRSYMTSGVDDSSLDKKALLELQINQKLASMPTEVTLQFNNDKTFTTTFPSKRAMMNNGEDASELITKSEGTWEILTHEGNKMGIAITPNGKDVPKDLNIIFYSKNEFTPDSNDAKKVNATFKRQPVE